jgi:hypothetical protein
MLSYFKSRLHPNYSHRRIVNYLVKKGMLVDKVYSHKHLAYLYSSEEDQEKGNFSIIISPVPFSTSIEITYKPGDDPEDINAAKGHEEFKTQDEAIRHIENNRWFA